MGTSARHHFSGVGLSVELQSGLLPAIVLTNGNWGSGQSGGPWPGTTDASWVPKG